MFKISADKNEINEEFWKERSERIKQFVDHLSQIKYIDASPKELKEFANRMQKIVLDQNKDDKSEEEGKKIQDDLNQINIVLKQGENIPIKDFNEQLSKILSQEMIASIEVSPKNLWDVSPFKEIGMIPIGPSENEQRKFPRMKDIYHTIVSKSTIKIPKSGEHKDSNTIWMYYGCWWAWTPSPIFPFTSGFAFGAYTKTKAEGFDAADPTIQELCLDPNFEYNWLFCIFAAATEKKRFYSHKILTRAEAIGRNAAGGGEKTRYNKWKVEYSTWGFCWVWNWRGVRSDHYVWLFPESYPWHNSFRV